MKFIISVLFLIVTTTVFSQNYIVSVTPSTEESVIRDYKLKPSKRLELVNGLVVKLSKHQLNTLRNDGRIKYVEEDGIVYTAGIQTGVGLNLDRIDNRLFSERDGTYIYDYVGLGVNIYIVDTGVYVQHPDYEGRARRGYGPQFNVNCNSHGTLVAGFAGSATYGVAKKPNIIAVNVYPCTGVTNVSDVVKGLDWVARQAKRNTPTQVVNMSLGSNYTLTFNDATQKLIDKGFVVVAAAGNSAVDACSQSPVANGLIKVAGWEGSDYSWSGNNYGSCVTLYAPLGGYSTYTTQYSGQLYGTSSASPHVAGAAALYLETNPYATPGQVKQHLLERATVDTLNNVPPTSPNLMLYTR
jgi:subtilisin family serine protease